VVALDAAAGAPVAAIAATGAFAAELAVSPSGRSVVFGSGAAALSIYDARTLQARVTLADATPSTIFHLAFSADEARVAATGLDGVLRIWDARTGALARVIQLGEAGNGVAWSPDGTLIATGGDDHELTIWDPISGRRLAHQPFADAVEDVAFSPRGDQLAATWLGNDALLWNVPTWDGDRAALDRWLGCYVPWRLDGDSVVAGPIDPSACGK
jgi:WD40 repeat protein